MNKAKGFTLIELLVVIAIIGILSSVVLASLNTAREKSRDAKRVSDIKQLQLALELYFDSQSPNTYPAALTDLSPTYIPADPADPLGGAYLYDRVSATSYHLGADLENLTHAVLSSDSDTTTTNITGADATECDGAGATTACYDVAN